MDWKNIVNIYRVEYEEWSINQKYSGGSSETAKTMKTQNMGFHLEILHPGKFSCPYHFHHTEEELFLVIEGSAMLRQNNHYREIGKGDLVYFSNTEEAAHQFYNHTNQDFKFLAISTIDKKDIAEYPDSNKINIRKSKKLFIKKDAVPYITGEENPEEFWDEKYLNNKDTK